MTSQTSTTHREPVRVVAALGGRDSDGSAGVNLVVAERRTISMSQRWNVHAGKGVSPGRLKEIVDNVLDLADDEDTVLAVNRPDDNDNEVAVLSAALYGAGVGLGLPTLWVWQPNPLRGAPKLSGLGDARTVTLARNALWLAQHGYLSVAQPQHDTAVGQ